MAINTVINTNVMALTAHRNLATVGNKQNKANQRLSSGKKINSAADDAAGLAISEKMKAQIKGLDMASKNSEDAISLIQTAEGSLTEVNNMLVKVRELTVQAGNDTNQKEDRVKISQEVSQLLTEIDSISNRTEFNEKKLNDGTFEKGHFQIGANSGQKLELSIGNMSVMGIGMDQIMDTFGIEKKVDLNITSSQVGVVGEGEAHKVTTNAVTAVNTDDVEGGTLTLKVKNNITGEEEELSFEFSETIVAAGATAKSTAEGVVNGLNKNTAFTDRFSITAGGNGELIIENKAVGGDYTISSVGFTTVKAGGGAGSAKLDANPPTVTTKGSHAKLDIANLAEGETLTIGGKTFTKVAAGNPKEVTNGFEDATQLKDLLAKDKITFDDTTGDIQMVDHQNTGLAGNYSVNEKEVSDKGKDYSKTLDIVDDSLKEVTIQRSILGANQNRLEYTINSLNTTSENLSAAKSRIEDTDMAKEMMNLTNANVLQQAAISILAQANQAPNNITQLLG